MKKALAILGIVVGAGLLAYALFGSPSDEERIRHRLESLAEAASYSEPPGNLLVRTLELRKRFSEGVGSRARVEIPELGISMTGPDPLVELAAGTPRVFRSLQLGLKSFECTLGADRRSAVVEAQATLEGQGSGEESEHAERAVHFELAKDDEHGWQVTELEVLTPSLGD